MQSYYVAYCIIDDLLYQIVVAEKYSIMIIVRNLILYTNSIAVVIVNRIAAMHGIKVRWLHLFYYCIQCGCMEEDQLIYSNNLILLHGFSLQYYVLVVYKCQCKLIVVQSITKILFVYDQ